MARILIARLGSMGDILHALPAAAAIRSALPDAVLGWLVEERWTELLTARGPKAGTQAAGPQKPVVNLIHTVDTRRWRQRFFHHGTLAEILGARRRIVDARYDVVLDFQGAIKSAVLARWSGAAAVAGFIDPREPAARWLYTQRFSRVGKHVIEQNHGLAAQALRPLLGEKELELVPPALPCDAAADAWAQSEIARLGIAAFAILNPGAGWGGKQWPAERFGAVATALARHNIKSLINAPPGEEELARAVVEAAPGHAFPFHCGIGQLIALTRRARLFVGGDTGPMHLATALNIPTVALFGPTEPERTGPFSRRAIALRHPDSKTTFSHHREPDAGLLQIEADEVVAAARHLLGGGGG